MQNLCSSYFQNQSDAFHIFYVWNVSQFHQLTDTKKCPQACCFTIMSRNNDVLLSPKLTKCRNHQKWGMFSHLARAQGKTRTIQESFFPEISVCCDPLLEPPCQGGSNEGSQHIVLWRTNKNYLEIILRWTSVLLQKCSCTGRKINDNCSL